MTGGLLTYKQAAELWGKTEEAFRERVRRGSVPEFVLFDRIRGPGKRPERFVLAAAFKAWLSPPQAKEQTP
jgi:hypothetical protein